MISGGLAARLRERFPRLSLYVAGRLDRNAVRQFVGALGPTGVALILQLGTFTITARGLGLDGFGQYAALLGLCVIGAEIIGIGSADLLVRAVSRDRNRFPAYFGNMLIIIAVTIVPTTILGMAIAMFVLFADLDPLHLAMLLFGEMLISRIAASTELVMVAFGHVARASLVRLATAGTRLIAAIAYFSFAAALSGWIEVAFAQAMLLAICYLVVTVYLYGPPRFRVLRHELGTGAAFGVNQAARASQGNLDRVILARFAENSPVGIYSAGARMIQLGLFPLQVVTRIYYPRFFLHGEDGIAASRAFAIRCLPVFLITGLLAAFSVAAAGLGLPFLLGAEFASSSETAMLLAFAMPFIALQYLAADALTGAGFQKLRAGIFAAAAVGFGFTLAAGAKLFGIEGVIAAFVLMNAVLALILWAAAFLVNDGSTATSGAPNGPQA